MLLAETSFRNQVEADIRPFRGLLLGLFFVTTGTNIDYGVRALLSVYRTLARFLPHSSGPSRMIQHAPAADIKSIRSHWHAWLSC